MSAKGGRLDNPTANRLPALYGLRIRPCGHSSNGGWAARRALSIFWPEPYQTTGDCCPTASRICWQAHWDGSANPPVTGEETTMLKVRLVAIAVAAVISGAALADEPLPVFEQRAIDNLVSTSKQQAEDVCSRGVKEACHTPQYWEQYEATERARWVKTVSLFTPTKRNCLRQAGYDSAKHDHSPGEGEVPKECKISKIPTKSGAAEWYYYLAYLYNTNAKVNKSQHSMMEQECIDNFEGDKLVQCLREIKEHYDEINRQRQP